LARQQRGFAAPQVLFSDAKLMLSKYGASAWFAGTGFGRRELFSHAVVAIPKPYPDAQLLLERRGFTQRKLEKGIFYQLNLYTTDFFGLPDDLFTDPEINWHGQQFGQKGLIAAAGLWVHATRATISTLQSDLCQQLYRHGALRSLHRTSVETHFRYWYAFLFNAVMDFCLDLNVAAVRSPTGNQVIANTKRRLAPQLFLRIYDHPSKRYRCREVSVAAARYWEIPVEENRDRIIRLAPATQPPHGRLANKCICIFHDIEENVDTDVSSDACADNLTRMLEIERSFGVNTTYNVLGSLLDRKRSEIVASDPGHSIGFHSFNHDLNDLNQLAQCRSVDLRVKGYRPPKSRITPELTDYRLSLFNFEWFACSVRGLGQADCRLQRGIVKIPIQVDDYALSLGQAYEQWEAGLLDLAHTTAFLSFGLHDCYADKWLPRYEDLLDTLAGVGQFVTAEDICAELFLAGASAGRDMKQFDATVSVSLLSIIRWFGKRIYRCV
jgi:hypothetical protein